MGKLTVSKEQINHSVSSIQKITPPQGFNLPSALTELEGIRVGNHVSFNIHPTDLVNPRDWARVYVDRARGTNQGDGLTWDTAKAGIGHAIEVAIASGVPTMILVKEGTYSRFHSASKGAANITMTLTAPIAIVAVGKVETGPFEEGLTWSKNTTYPHVYETNRSVAQYVFDSTKINEVGEPYRYIVRNTLADCAALKGSCYYEGNNVYLNPLEDDVVNDATARVFLKTTNLKISGNHNVFLSGIDFKGGDSGCLNINGGEDNIVVVKDCTFKYAFNGSLNSGLGAIDGVVVLACGLFASFNSESSYNAKDGFNFHISNGIRPSALMVNCRGYYNGVDGLSLSCNGFTLHDGCVGIDINGEWLGSRGTNSGHVNDNTQVLAINSVSGNAVGDLDNGGSIGFAGYGAWSGACTLWLDGCEDIGADVGIYAASPAQINIRNHKGVGRHLGNVVEY